MAWSEWKKFGGEIIEMGSTQSASNTPTVSKTISIPNGTYTLVLNGYSYGASSITTEISCENTLVYDESLTMATQASVFRIYTVVVTNGELTITNSHSLVWSDDTVSLAYAIF